MRRDRNIDLEDILTDKVREADLLEVPLADRVFKAFFFSFIFISIFFFIQLINIGFLKNSFYSERAFANVTDIKIDPAPRGIIVDRFDKPLLQNESAFNVFLLPRDLPPGLAEKEAVFEKISKALSINLEDLIKKITEKNWGLSDRMLLANNLSHEELIALKSEVLRGIEIEPAFKRVHRSPIKFSHILGYIGLVHSEDLNENSNLMIDDEIGRTGLESYYDAYLRGINGEEIFWKSAKGETKESRIVQMPKSGALLEVFIDAEFQEYFYDQLKGALLNLGRNAGVGIALNPKNGEVLAMVSVPGFDSLNVASFLNKPHEPLFNRAISGLYSPGSTIKPLVATAALKEGVISPEKQIFSAGFIEIPNPYNSELPSRFLDWKPHGWVDLYSAIARSSNVYFYEIGGGFENQKGLGIAKLKEWWRKFGLAEKSGIDLTAESNGFLPDPMWKEQETKIPWRLGDTYNVSIGQGDLLLTPLSLLNYISAVASGGKIYKPRLMKDIVDGAGQIILESKPEVLKDLTNDIGAVLEHVQKGMKDAVAKPYGTANSLSNLPISVAAKTGSAQIQNNTKVNAFFTGFAPADDPEIAILVMVEDAREGSLNTVPIAKNLFLWYYENRLKK